jgi:AcrR family transcriptional regulator
MKVEKYSLRQKKHAKTKIAIMDAFLKRLEKSRFESISIKVICRDLEISEGTFFNYFPQKRDIIDYYVQLVLLKAISKAEKASLKAGYISLINNLFKELASEIKNINVVYQVIAVLAVSQEKLNRVAITDIEKRLAFPDSPGIEESPAVFIDVFLRDCLEKALKGGELPKKSNIDDILVSLLTILSGTLLAAKVSGIQDYGYHYSRQLKLLFKGLGLKADLNSR